jgi:hypothetical protein
VSDIFPAGNAYRGEHVQLDLPVLVAGENTVIVPDGIEAVLVLLNGDVTLWWGATDDGVSTSTT